MSRTDSNTVPTLVRFTLLFAISALLVLDSNAQTRSRRLGIGGMVGRTAGASLKLYVDPILQHERVTELTAVTVEFSLRGDDGYLWTAHAVVHHDIRDSPLNVYLGPGAALEADGKDLFWGLSSIFGAFFNKSRFEVFMQVSPRLILTPEIRAEFGSAVGLRYYL